MAKIDDLSAVDGAVETPAASAVPPEAVAPVEGGSAREQSENRSAWYRALNLAEPILGALSASPGILASQERFSECTQQISGAVQSVAGILKAQQNIHGSVGSMVAAPLCAASWQIQVEKGKKDPQLDPAHIARIALQFNEAIGDAEFPARQMPYIARDLVENPAAAALFGTNYRETLHGMTSVLQGESEGDSRGTEPYEYFLSRLASLQAEQIGSAIHSARIFMEPGDKGDVPGWHTLAFWGESAEFERAREMLELALATQIALGNGWYDRVHKNNPELSNILVKRSRADDTLLLARAAREYADRVEYGAHFDLRDVEKLSMVMCTAMREGMNVFHDTREKVFTATERMLQQKYPNAKTSKDMLEAIKREGWPDRIKAAYQSAKTLREGIFSGIRDGMSAMEMSVSMKNRAAVGAALAPILKPSNLRVFQSAFPFLPEGTTPEERCRIALDWGEQAVKDLARAASEAIDIPRLDRPSMQGNFEKVLQASLRHSDVVVRCAKEGRASDTFPEMVKELRTVLQVASGMVPEPVRKRSETRFQDALERTEKSLCDEFRQAAAEERLAIPREEREERADKPSVQPGAGD